MSTKLNSISSLNKVKICNVAYLNSAPYHCVKELDFVEYSEEPPAECARKLHEGECDLALIPLAELFWYGNYETLPLGIATSGKVESVLLFSNSDYSKLNNIYTDNSSQSSVNLLKVLITEANKDKVNITINRLNTESFPAELRDNEGILVIGDKSIKFAQQYKYRFDLSELWKEKTNLPFIFAIWAYKKDRISADKVKQITEKFKKGIDHKTILARAWAEKEKIDFDFAENYVNNQIAYQLTAEHLAGAELYYTLGRKYNIFPQHVSLFSKTPRTIDAILEDSSKGKRISIADGLRLATEASLADLSLAADIRREALHKNEGVSYIIDRNINYTNICNVYCQFCAFYRAPVIPGRVSRKSHGGYTLTKEEIGKKIQETIDIGGVQILLQGGLNPELGIEYYEDLFRWIKSNYKINLHALSADEILHISKVSNLSIAEVFDRLIAAGLGSFPGGGAEILVDRVRRRVARLKSPAASWLEVHRTAHRKGLTSTCTMMFGVEETWEDRINHLHKLRTLQTETSGFTAFICWPFQDENLTLKKGDTSASEYLRAQSVARLFLDNIANVQSSWVTMGPSIGQLGLFFGANDFGSVMLEENVVSAAGTTYCINEDAIQKHLKDAGFSSWKRDIHYNHVR